MASTDDLRFFDRYAKVSRAVRGFEMNDFVSIVAALIWLDREAGLDDDTNMIIISEELSLFMPFWVMFTDPEINLLLAMPASGNIQIDRAVADQLHKLLMRPVEVVFLDPRHEQRYPIIQGLRRIVAVDPTLGMGKGIRAYTARRSGEHVQLPR